MEGCRMSGGFQRGRSLASSVSPESLKVSKEMSSTCWGSGKGLPAGHNAQGMMGGSDVCVGVPRGAQ